MALAFLDRSERRSYYFSVAVIAGGLILSVWAYQNSVETANNFHSRAVQIISVTKRDSEDTFVFETVEADYVFPGYYMDGHTKHKLLTSAWSQDAATIWVSSPSSRLMSGLETRDIRVDPNSVAAIDRSMDRKLFHLGLIIVGVGFLIAFLHFISLRNK
ncbi:MAG TPA: hypothetical protein PLL77_15330 [Pyrinomonadaceae bacterium]|nr:hypothetical protein [Pyrinomonadaceae bacterium]